MIPFLALATSAMAACGESGESLDAPAQPENTVSPDGGAADRPDSAALKVNFIVGDRTLTATMADNAAARDFMARLPLEVTLEDFNRTTEKIFYPDPALTLEGVARGCAPTPGDITIYVPWGNVAIFCKSWSYSSDLVKIGRIDGDGIEALSVSGDLRVRIERP